MLHLAGKGVEQGCDIREEVHRHRSRRSGRVGSHAASVRHTSLRRLPG